MGYYESKARTWLNITFPLIKQHRAVSWTRRHCTERGVCHLSSALLTMTRPYEAIPCLPTCRGLDDVDIISKLRACPVSEHDRLRKTETVNPVPGSFDRLSNKEKGRRKEGKAEEKGSLPPEPKPRIGG